MLLTCGPPVLAVQIANVRRLSAGGPLEAQIESAREMERLLADKPQPFSAPVPIFIVLCAENKAFLQWNEVQMTKQTPTLAAHPPQTSLLLIFTRQ